MAACPIVCKDCGSDYVAARKDATRCPPCRLLTMLVYAAKKFPGNWKCKACGEKYRPAGKTSRVCGTCDVAAARAERATCKVCSRDAPMYERVPVCLPCVKDPEKQKTVVRALKRGQEKRAAAHA